MSNQDAITPRLRSLLSDAPSDEWITVVVEFKRTSDPEPAQDQDRWQEEIERLGGADFTYLWVNDSARVRMPVDDIGSLADLAYVDTVDTEGELFLEG